MINYLRSGLNDLINAVPFVSPAMNGNLCEIDRKIVASRISPITGIAIINAIAVMVLACLAADLLAGTALAAAVSVLPGGLLVLSIFAIFFITLVSTAFGLAALDDWLTKRAIDKVAVTKFMEKTQVPYEAALWIIKRPQLVQVLLEQPGVDLAKQIYGHKNIFQMALRKGGIEVCDLLWEKMTFGDQKQVFDLSSENVRGALGSGLCSNERVELKSRLEKFQKLALEEEKKACTQFIFGINASAAEHSLPRLPQEIKAMILGLRQESQKSKSPKLDGALSIA